MPTDETKLDTRRVVTIANVLEQTPEWRAVHVDNPNSMGRHSLRALVVAFDIWKALQDFERMAAVVEGVLRDLGHDDAD